MAIPTKTDNASNTPNKTVDPYSPSAPPADMFDDYDPNAEFISNDQNAPESLIIQSNNPNTQPNTLQSNETENNQKAKLFEAWMLKIKIFIESLEQENIKNNTSGISHIIDDSRTLQTTIGKAYDSAKNGKDTRPLEMTIKIDLEKLVPKFDTTKKELKSPPSTSKTLEQNDKRQTAEAKSPEHTTTSSPKMTPKPHKEKKTDINKSKPNAENSSLEERLEKMEKTLQKMQHTLKRIEEIAATPKYDYNITHNIVKRNDLF